MSLDSNHESADSEPYPGPRPFTPAESDRFKGRDKESRDVRDLLLSYQVVVLYSKSGAGKSSLVNAGLRPLMIEEGFEVLPVARVGGKVPPNVDESKIRNIFAFNTLSSCMDANAVPADLPGAELSECLAEPSETPRLLVFDQFEELFTAFQERWRDRANFFLQLRNLCRASKNLRSLLVIREDHVAELDPHADLLPTGLRMRYRLERLREMEALEAIVAPMQRAGYTFQDGVAKELVSNLAKIQTDAGEVAGEFVEPVHLQVVCRNLWRNRPTERRSITAADVQKFADVDEALAAFYSQAVQLAADKSRTSESSIRGWVEKKLITPGGTRALVYIGKTYTEGLPNEAVRVLDAERVIRAESRAGATWYELTHDRFIGPIRVSNRAWLATHGRWKRVTQLVAAGVVLVLISILAFSYLHRKQNETNLAQAQREMREGLQQEQDDNFDAALQHYSTALQLFNRLGDRGGQASTYSQIGAAYSKKNQDQNALTAYNLAFEIHKRLGDDKAAAKDLMDRGNAEAQSGDREKAGKSYKKALEKFERLNSEDGLAGQASALCQLGQAYRWLTKYDLSLDCLQRSLKLYSKLKEPQPRGEATAKEELASLYFDRGDYDLALELYNQVRPMLVDLGYHSMAAYAALNLGATLFAMGKQTEAFKQYELSGNEFRRLHDEGGEAWVLIKLSQWYVGMHRCNEGLSFGKQGRSLAKRINDSTLMGLASGYMARAYLCSKSLQEAEMEAQHALEGATQRKEKNEQDYNSETLKLIAAARDDMQRAVENGKKPVEGPRAKVTGGKRKSAP